MVRRLLCVAAGVLFLSAFTAAPAFAQVGPLGYRAGPSITLCSLTVFPGETVTASGENFAPGEEVSGTITSTPITIGSTMVRNDGTFTLTFTVPQLAPGTHTLTVRGTTGDLASTTFTVLPQPQVRPCLPTTPVTTPPVTAAPPAVPPSAAPPSAAPPSAVTPSAPSAVTPSAPSAGLAFTGAEISLMALAGAILLVVGGMLVLTTRKRRSSAAS